MGSRDNRALMPDHSRWNDIFQTYSASPLTPPGTYQLYQKNRSSTCRARVKLAWDQLQSSFHQNVPSLPFRYKDNIFNPNGVPLFSLTGSFYPPSRLRLYPPAQAASCFPTYKRDHFPLPTSPDFSPDIPTHEQIDLPTSISEKKQNAPNHGH